MKYGCKPCVSACTRLFTCVRVRLTGGQRSLCRHGLGGTPNVGKAAAVSLTHSLARPVPLPVRSSSSSSSSRQCYCSLRADNMQGAMWCVSVLSSGLSTVGVREKCGLRAQEVKEMKSLTSSQVRQESDEPKKLHTADDLQKLVSQVCWYIKC